ncbi:hypothetical protein AKO1_001215, partial [Acrasis kona]
MSEEELNITSYEMFLLSTKFHSILSSEDLATAIVTIRQNLDFSPQHHHVIIRDLIIDKNLFNVLSVSTEPEQYSTSKLRKSSQKDFFQNQLDKMKSWRYRWELFVTFVGTKERKVSFLERQLLVYCNCLISSIMDNQTKQPICINNT